MKIPGDVLFIINELNARGFGAFAVGGCVRDSLMGNTPKDWDVATSALPEDVKAVFPHTADTGLKHGTVTVLINRERYEVTTYRVDGVYKDGRRPETVTFAADISDDLSRRDFTMNAIAYAPGQGYIDPFCGMADIRQKKIRCVGNPAHRFGEDALRMLRAVRFAAQLGFTIEKETYDAIPKLNENMKNISAERIREELTRLLTAAFPEKMVLLEETGLLFYVLRGRGYGGDLYETAEKIKNTPNRINLRAALFFAWARDEAPKILRDLRFDNQSVRDIGVLVKYLPEPIPESRYEIKKLMSLISAAQTEELFILKQAESALAMLRDILRSGECFLLKDLAVKGNDLIALGVKPGKEMGQILESLLDAVMREPGMNVYEKLIRIIPNPRS
jgi:tRNA nucleotidyltransferase (CCA-adding enzyme)